MNTDGADLEIPGQGIDDPFDLRIRDHPGQSVANSRRVTS